MDRNKLTARNGGDTVYMPSRYCWAAAIATLFWTGAAALGQSEPKSNAVPLTLRSFHFATPLTLHGDPLERKITTIELRLPKLDGKSVEGNIRFDESELTFDKFGDAQVVRRQGDMPLPVKLEALPAEDEAGSGRKLYRVRLLDQRFNPSMHLVYSQDPLAPSKLLIRTTHNNSSGRDRTLLRMLPLAKVGELEREEAQDELRSPLALYTPQLRSGGVSDPSLPGGDFNLHGELGESIDLTHDLNHVEFNDFGDGVSTTLAGYGALAFKLKKLAIEDPSGRGRSAWDLIPEPRREAGPFGAPREDPTRVVPRYRLVLSQRAGGPHRLIVYTGETVQYVLPLINYTWQHFQVKNRELAAAPVGERKAIGEIRRLVGDTFDFEVEDSHVVDVDFSGRSATRETVAQLSHLTHLKRLSFGYCRNLRPGDLEPLAQLTSLENLAFYVTPVTDESLQHVGKLRNLRYLRLYDEALDGETKITASQPTDKGMAELANLTKLESLDLYGDQITDEGLAHLQSLKDLGRIYLHQTNITVTGLVAFCLQHPEAQVDSWVFEYHPSQASAVLKGERVTNDSFEALKKLPVIRHLRCDDVNGLTAEGTKHLVTLPSLESLRLSGCDVKDEAMAPLADLKGLKRLELWYCRSIGDEGVTALHGLNLEHLNLTGTAVTAQGLAQLRTALPNCVIEKQR